MMWVILHFFCYIDGVYTIIDMATAYGTALGLAGRWHYLAVLDAGGTGSASLENYCWHGGLC
ncbi:hypothetical protein [Roseburia sp. AM16-25]|mgnify:FL=1|uniref:hypothetical protein n=1 Tax=Roseburia sp. AM16-25 TaxID=2292065 RepID=UPI001314D0C4|nr:hypothetical protein [Roseburia sp. AM16-25]